MSVRQSIKSTSNDPSTKAERLPSGYDQPGIPSEFNLPSCGLEDIDKAIFNLFDKEINFSITQNGNTKQVPVVFATGERFALIKRRVPIRDENDAFILPLVSIRRTSLDQSAGSERLADVGDLVVRRRLSERDPIYQNLINQQNILHQDNVRSSNNNSQSGDPIGSLPGRVNSRRTAVRTATGGPTLSNNLKDTQHIYEVISIPFPHFVTVTYEITFWTSYTQHMNSMIEKFVTSYTGNRNQFKIETDKGYWFVAYPADTVSNEDNFDDFTNEQRIVRYTFSMTVPAYIVAPQGSGDLLPFRKFVSAPDVSFDIFTSNAPIVQHPSGLPDPTGDLDKFVLSDVNQINTAGDLVEGERNDYLKARTFVKNPFTGENEIEYLKILTTNQRQGETVVSARIVKKIDTI